jgi:hypothetical protein
MSAIDHPKQRAATGDTEPQIELAKKYTHGSELPINEKEAAGLDLLAAEAVSERVQEMVSFMYEEGGSDSSKIVRSTS